MLRILRTRNFYILVVFDACLVCFSYVLSYLLRFEGSIPAQQLALLKSTLVFILPLKLLVFMLFSVYRGMWRYTSYSDLMNVLKGSSVSSLLIVGIVAFVYRFQGFSRSIFFMDWLLTVICIGGIRICVRIVLFDKTVRMFFDKEKWKSSKKKKRLLIVGAGSAGEKILREIQESSKSAFLPIGFLDDDTHKISRTIHGLPVLGTTEDIAKYYDRFDEIVIAVPSISSKDMRRIVELCDSTGKKYRIVPGIWELVEGKVLIDRIRKVSVADLMGREEVELDTASIEEILAGKNVLVTGAGGSIGSELVRQIYRFKPRALSLLDFSEYNIFRLENEFRQRNGGLTIQPYLVDIRDKNSLRYVFERFEPEVIFHAAAYKHVPIMEMHPWEAIRNNVAGTLNLASLAAEHNCECFVLVSTDKAVRPTNVMGATKRICEMIALCMNVRWRKRYLAVRFGNVLASSGSALPLFQEQIRRGGPVTITHPEMSRYFMSIPEAAQLVLQASSMGKGGEIFILDMGKPMKVLDVAKDLIRLSGFEPERDIPIEFIGVRPGEKLYEELITEGEGIAPTGHKKIFVLEGASCDYDQLMAEVAELISVSEGYDAHAIKAMLKKIVPEYQPQCQ
ncbi:MAG: polysaccharide biosynthesis protein [Deltaproteobacteria bacterium]|nr:polysaccharide biosynthesis protein [Deltaproteobacteria bacterium]